MRKKKWNQFLLIKLGRGKELAKLMKGSGKWLRVEKVGGKF